MYSRLFKQKNILILFWQWKAKLLGFLKEAYCPPTLDLLDPEAPVFVRSVYFPLNLLKCQQATSNL